jgi:hypothetical protein
MFSLLSKICYSPANYCLVLALVMKVCIIAMICVNFNQKNRLLGLNLLGNTNKDQMLAATRSDSQNILNPSVLIKVLKAIVAIWRELLMCTSGAITISRNATKNILKCSGMFDEIQAKQNLAVKHESFGNATDQTRCPAGQQACSTTENLKKKGRMAMPSFRVLMKKRREIQRIKKENGGIIEDFIKPAIPMIKVMCLDNRIMRLRGPYGYQFLAKIPEESLADRLV